jgi:RecA-family ATPase
MMHAQPGPSASPINPKYFTGAKPHTHQCNLWHLHPAIVKRLVPLPNWVNWKWELNKQGSMWTKVPYQPRNPERKAETDNKNTWSTYNEAVANVEAGMADGIGFVLFETNICAFDIDDCRNLITGEVDPTALALIKRCGETYVETTVSGTGLRIIGLGGTKYVLRKQAVKGSNVSIESYRYCARYITISGLTFDGVKPTMADLGNIDTVLTEVVEELDRGNAGPSDPGPRPGPGNGAGDGTCGCNFFREAALPRDLMYLIRYGVAVGARSQQFHHAVKWLKELQWSVDDIVALLSAYPDGIASKYAADDRIEKEVFRAYFRPEKPKPGNPGSDTGPGSGPGPGTSPPPQPLPWLNMSNWDNEPVPERKWAIRDRVPLNQAGLFSGEGGTGKSIVELMKNVAHVAGKDWLGSLPEPGPAFYLGAEDDTDEIHIRLAAIAKHYGVSFEELITGGLHILPLLGEDATLCAVNPRTGRVETTALYDQIYEAAGDIKPKNISIDTLSRAFAGNEIDRVQVYGFAQHMQALAKVASGSATVLSHPSLAGIASGSGISGSTAWHGAFRFRQYLKGVKAENGEQPEDDLRELEFKKNQYGPRGETIVLRYQNGLFLPVAGASNLDKIAREARVEALFMDLLRRFAGQGRNVSHKNTAPNYAPTVFAKEPEATKQRVRRSEFEAAIRRLFASDRIMVESYGRPSQPSSRIAVKPPKAAKGDAE